MTTRHEIKAIPTKYNGIEFRSRLEARWAVFFDALGIKYFYEYEGYQLPSGWYVPDFYLPEVNGGCFVEIKPTYPSDEEIAFCRELCATTGREVFLQFGVVDVLSTSKDEDGLPIEEANYAIGFRIDGWLESGEPHVRETQACCIGMCTDCHHIEFKEFENIHFMGWRPAKEAPCRKDPEWDAICTIIPGMSFVRNPKFISAYKTAQKTKFW